MNKLVSSALLALTIGAFSLNAAEDYYASVNGKKITKSDVAMLLGDPRVDISKLPKPAQEQVINQIIDRKLLAEHALKQMKNDKKFNEALNSMKEDLAFEMWNTNSVKNIKVSDKELKDFYNKNKESMKKPASMRARHILVKTEKEAQALINQLNKASKKKAKFIELAKTKSVGPSGKNGGDLGEFAETQMVPEFSAAAKALKKNSYSKKPVKTQFGYHVIYLEDKKPAGSLSFNEVKGKITQLLTAEKYNKKIKPIVADLKKKAKIVIK